MFVLRSTYNRLLEQHKREESLRERFQTEYHAKLEQNRELSKQLELERQALTRLKASMIKERVEVPANTTFRDAKKVVKIPTKAAKAKVVKNAVKRKTK